MLDMEATSLEQIADLILDNMVNAGSLTSEIKDKVTPNNGIFLTPVHLFLG